MSTVNRGGRGRNVLVGRNQTMFVGTDADIEDATLTADRGVYFSSDGRRRKEELLNVVHKKRRVNITELDDSLAIWTPVSVDEVDGLTDGPTAETDDPPPSVLGKRKTYESSVRHLLYIAFKATDYHRPTPWACGGPFREFSWTNSCGTTRWVTIPRRN
jgi:hypothetical protein